MPVFEACARRIVTGKLSVPKYPAVPSLVSLFTKTPTGRHLHRSKYIVPNVVAVNFGVPLVVSCFAGAERVTSKCEQAVVVAPPPSQMSAVTQEPNSWKRVKRKISKTFRLLRRMIQLMVALAPIAFLYPIQRLCQKDDDDEQDAHDAALLERKQVDGPLGWYLQLCLYCVEWSGAAVIKLMQWAGSRPDLFGRDFCAVFSTLQDDTTPHSWRHTERVMREAYGNDWKERIHLEKVIGSGCIGQVYTGFIKDANGNKQKVAVKVLHPNVEEDIDCDLELMRSAASIFRRFDTFNNLKYLNLEGAIDEFATLLKVQLDLREEAANMEKFNKNFANDSDVMFPKLVEGFEPTNNVLIETFCDGIPLLQFAREHREDQELLNKMCHIGIRAVCKMIFIDNFLHGDLHPGNVLVSPDDHRFILLDLGMVTEYTDADHRLIVDILTSFIRRDGRRAGQLLIDDSNARLSDDQAREEELYIDKIEALTIRAQGKDYFLQNLGVYISYICEAAATHHVMMNQAFVSAALAVKIQEGIALALDPSVAIWKVANPIILQSEFRRKLSDLAREVKETVL